jgi:hypothetical protein
MLNISHLQHITMGIKLFKAMREAVKTGLPVYVTNRKDQAIIRVNYSRNTVNAFKFWCGKSQKDISDLIVNKVLRVTV